MPENLKNEIALVGFCHNLTESKNFGAIDCTRCSDSLRNTESPCNLTPLLLGGVYFIPEVSCDAGAKAVGVPTRAFLNNRWEGVQPPAAQKAAGGTG